MNNDMCIQLNYDSTNCSGKLMAAVDVVLQLLIVTELTTAVYG